MSMDKHSKLEVGTSSCDCGNESTRLIKSAHGEYIAVCNKCYSNIDARDAKDVSEDTSEDSDQ